MKTLLVVLLLTLSSFANMPHVPRNIQAPNVAADFWTQWGFDTPRICLMVLVTPKTEFGGSAAAIGFTSNTRDMTLPGHVGITFQSAPGITPTAIETVLDEPSNLEMTGIYQLDSFTHEDIMAGKWSFAEIEIFLVSWQRPELGEFVIFKGNMGEFKDRQTSFTAEARGLLSRLSNDVDWQTQRFCRWIAIGGFGGPGCKKDLNGTVTIDGTAYNITQTGLLGTPSEGSDIYRIQIFDIEYTHIPPDHLYANGRITATTGVNAGVSREIADNDHRVLYDSVFVTLKRPFPFPVEEDTDFTIILGCNGTIEDCMKFDNIINRGAEDYIPGIESVHKVIDQ